MKNSSFFVRLDVERTHINQKIEIFENPTSACQTIVNWTQFFYFFRLHFFVSFLAFGRNYSVSTVGL
jgi:hypothetical protein